MRVLRTVALGGLLGFFAFNASGAGCSPQSDFQCLTNEDCIGQGAGGLCEPNSFCSFPDASCIGTMRRWDDRAAESLAGDCVDPGMATATDTDTDGSSESSSTTEEPEEEEGSSTTMSVEPVSSSGEEMTTDPTGEMTSTGGNTSTGAAGACDMMYGGAEGYMFCEELADGCRFVAALNMAMACNDVCAAFGGTCNGAELNDADPCTSSGAGTCEQADVTDIICICSL